MGVAENFKAFRANYLIPADTVGSISRRYKRITKQLMNRPGIAGGPNS